MTDDSWRRIETAFHEALDRPPASRGAFLDEWCRDDADLRAEVSSLLAIHEAASCLVEESSGSSTLDPVEPARRLPVNGATSADALTGEGARLGRYRLGRIIATGGMGVVYESAQERPYRRVALKVMRPGAVSAAVSRRFAHEAEILGRLQHPGIAQIFEAGSAASEHGARSYFAMEYIDGLPLTVYAEGQDLTPEQRLELFARVCDATAYAHEQGVIHRDLKPANILVTVTGQPKIVDFGVARLTDRDRAFSTMHTQVGQLVGTLQYMSPEQCGAHPDALDARSDVYALGIVCHELVAGQLPYDLTEMSVPAAIQLITGHEPSPVKTRGGALRGDIGTIIGKALEKDPERRYPSAAALAADIRRYLNQEPIAARPRSALYQLRKFAARNRAFVVATLLAFILGQTSVVAVMAWFFEYKNVQRTRRIGLQQQSLIAEATRTLDAGENIVAINSFLKKNRTMLEPSVESLAFEVRGSAYYKTGEYEQAARDHRRSLDLHREMFGIEDQATLRAVNLLIDSLRAAGRSHEAGVLLQEAIDSSGYGPETAVGDCTTAERCTLVLRWLRLRFNQGEVLHDRGRLNKAEQRYHQTLQLLSDVQTAYERLAPGTYKEPFEKRHFVLEIKEALAKVLIDARRPEATSSLEDLLAVHCSRQDRDEIAIARLRVLLGRARLQAGDTVVATNLLEAAWEVIHDKFGGRHPKTIQVLVDYCRVLMAAGRFEEAARHLSSAIKVTDADWPDHWRTAVLHGVYGRCLIRLGCYADARDHLEQAHKRLLDMFGNDDYRIGPITEALDELHERRLQPPAQDDSER